MSTIDEVKSKIDIVDLVSEAGVKLRKSGRSYSGFCPFHDNKRTPAFVVWPELGTWKCYGACNEGGDSIILTTVVIAGDTMVHLLQNYST